MGIRFTDKFIESKSKPIIRTPRVQGVTPANLQRLTACGYRIVKQDH